MSFVTSNHLWDRSITWNKTTQRRYNSVIYENQARFIRTRIQEVEKYFGELCSGFGSYSRKLKGVRDRGDQVSKALLDYVTHESFNHSTKEALQHFAENFSGVQDYRDVEIGRLDTQVIQPLTAYGVQCKTAKTRLKQAFAARDKEVKQKQRLDSLKAKNPADRNTISRAESELQRASVDASHSSKILEEEIEEFERKKLADIKKIMMEFINIELTFHAKALEQYTKCYHNLSAMNEDEDLEEFRNSLRPPNTQKRIEQVQRANSAPTGTGVRSTPVRNPFIVQGTSQKPAVNGLDSSHTMSMYSVDDDDEDEEDDEDDDEDVSEEDDEETEYSEETPRRK